MTPPPPKTHPALAARRARIRRIRARVAAGATALFLALFAGLYVQMASGHDPALGADSSQVATAAQSSQDTATQQQDPAPMTTSAS